VSRGAVARSSPRIGLDGVVQTATLRSPRRERTAFHGFDQETQLLSPDGWRLASWFAFMCTRLERPLATPLHALLHAYGRARS
jgi:hypothetical protein